jgi:uncharacterized protein YkwD
MSPRHGNGRRPTSHRRPRAGLPVRRIALTAGVLTVVAGVGTGVAVVRSGGEMTVAEARPTADRAASSASPMAEEAVPTTNTASPPASASKSPSPKRTKAISSATPRRTATPDARNGERPTVRQRSAPAVTRSARDVTQEAAQEATQAPDAAASSAARILKLVNKERAAAGCRPVTANSKLSKAAQTYTDVMARVGVLSHTGPDGSSVGDRVQRAGYIWSTVGENIAQGQRSADAVMDAWMDSPGHRANILNCAFRELGVGVRKGNGGPWWTQNFGTSR